MALGVATDIQFGFPKQQIQEVAKTSDYTILPADNQKMFTNAGALGAVVFTLPTIGVGYEFYFFVDADQNFTVKTPSNATIVVVAGSRAAYQVAFTTSSDKAGGCLRIFSNQAGTLWYVQKLCSNALTVTT